MTLGTLGTRRRGQGLSIAIATAILPVACGSSSNGEGGTHDAGAGSASYDDGSSDAASAPIVTYGDGAAPNLNLDGAAPVTFKGCAATSLTATLAPLDLFFMIDTSGSMDDLVAAGQSKWNAVVAAMTAFVNDPASAGLGVGLQYFPLAASGVPATCTSSAQCGAAGPCVLALCSNVPLTIPCATGADCPNKSSCVPVGYCHDDHNYLCPSPGASTCGSDPNGFPLGTCDVMTSSTCAAGDSCSATDYQAPAVAIASLPGVAPTVVSSLGAHSPAGNTPTSAALQGAIDQAAAYAAAHAGHTVAAVLATDGIPDECMPNVAAVAQIAASGAAKTPSIKTFAIGVFTPDEVSSGTSALDQIATSGGTTSAFIINASTQNVEQQFSAALASIRGAALPCTYQVPKPEGGLPDFNKLNVQYTTGVGAVSTIGYVESAARCSGQAGGWYYDSDPAEGGVPSEILVCPSTCSTFKGDAHGKVDILLGCQTVLM